MRRLILLLLCLVLWAQLCEAKLAFVSIQDQITVSHGERGIKVPIYVSDLTGMNIISAEITVSYNPDVVVATDVDLSGTIASGSLLAYNVKGSSICIAFTRANSFSGGGTFAFVVFDATTQSSEASSNLEVVKAKLNEGKKHTLELGTSDVQTPPMGVSSISFKGMKLKMELSSNGSTGEIRVTLINKPPVGTLPTGVASLLNKYWVIERPGGGSFTANLTFTLGPGMIGPGDEANPSNLKLFRRKVNSTGNWTLIASATSADASTGEVKFEGITSFSQFTIGSTGDSSLPVELSSLWGETLDDGVLLRWRVQSEVDNLGFAVYRGESEAGDYERVGFIPSVGNTGSPADYTFVDRDVIPGGTYYYYIESVEISGERKPSQVIRVVVPSAPLRFSLLQSYPNPFNPEVWIPYELAEEAPVKILIYDSAGRLVRTLDLGIQPRGRYTRKSKAAYWDGRNEQGDRVASGVYFYTLKAGEYVRTRKMAIRK
jgi:hypothetical protein